MITVLELSELENRLQKTLAEESSDSRSWGWLMDATPKLIQAARIAAKLNELARWTSKDAGITPEVLIKLEELRSETESPNCDQDEWLLLNERKKDLNYRHALEQHGAGLIAMARDWLGNRDELKREADDMLKTVARSALEVITQQLATKVMDPLLKMGLEAAGKRITELEAENAALKEKLPQDNDSENDE